MRHFWMCSFLFALACLPATSAEPAAWGPLAPLIGDWIGEGGGGPGQGSGSFSFQPDLQGKILVRKNRAAYPASQDRPAFVHDDLMVVYRETPESPLRAIYFDSEGHTIHYAVDGPPEGHTAIFLSDADPAQPRYRLTYTVAAKGQVKIKFEIAPPGKPDAFSTYIEAGAHRASSQ